MRWRLHRFTLTKDVPLTISRGTTATVEHLLLELEADRDRALLLPVGDFDVEPAVVLDELVREHGDMHQTVDC